MYNFIDLLYILYHKFKSSQQPEFRNFEFFVAMIFRTFWSDQQDVAESFPRKRIL